MEFFQPWYEKQYKCDVWTRILHSCIIQLYWPWWRRCWQSVALVVGHPYFNFPIFWLYLFPLTFSPQYFFENQFKSLFLSLFLPLPPAGITLFMNVPYFAANSGGKIHKFFPPNFSPMYFSHHHFSSRLLAKLEGI